MKAIKIVALVFGAVSFSPTVEAIIAMNQRGRLPKGDYLNDNRAYGCFQPTANTLLCQNSRYERTNTLTLTQPCPNIQYINDTTIGCVSFPISTPQVP